MTLKEQILDELRRQRDIHNEEIKKLNDSISTERFAMSTINGGALAGTARSACQSRIDMAQSQKNVFEAKNVWINDMLSKYGRK